MIHALIRKIAPYVSNLSST